MAGDPQLSLVEDGLDPETLRESSYGGTPLALVRQVLEVLRDRAGLPTVRRFLEPGSGPAPFCRVAREVWPGVHTTACDIRSREREFAELNCDAFICERFGSTAFEEALARMAVPAGGAELLATNPPFPDAFDFAEAGLVFSRDVVLLLPDDWWKRKEDDPAEFIDRGLDRALVAQLQIPGRVAFYGGSATDRVSYSWWCFSTGRDGTWRLHQGAPRIWRCEMLPMLPSEQRRWAGCRPGMEAR